MLSNKFMVPIVLKKHSTYIFKAYVPLKCSITTQKTWISVFNDVDTSD